MRLDSLLSALGVRPPTPEWGIMVAEGATLYYLWGMVAGDVSRVSADASGLLL